MQTWIPIIVSVVALAVSVLTAWVKFSPEEAARFKSVVSSLVQGTAVALAILASVFFVLVFLVSSSSPSRLEIGVFAVHVLNLNFYLFFWLIYRSGSSLLARCVKLEERLASMEEARQLETATPVLGNRSGSTNGMAP